MTNYKELSQKLTKEKDELNDKITRLQRFLDNYSEDGTSTTEIMRQLMESQLTAMRQYHIYLGSRLAFVEQLNEEDD